MKSLPDGTYDVIVVDAEPTDDGDVRIELTITLGPHLGRMVVLRGGHVDGAGSPRPGAATRSKPADPVALLGIPGTLRVRQGEPTFHPELV